jgi:hypothetical protein
VWNSGFRRSAVRVTLAAVMRTTAQICALRKAVNVASFALDAATARIVADAKGAHARRDGSLQCRQDTVGCAAILNHDPYDVMRHTLRAHPRRAFYC